MTDPMQTPGMPSWIQHSGPDGKDARSFYKKVMGWKLDEMPMKDGSSYTAITVGDKPIGGFSPMPEDAGAWTIYVTVDDVDACIARASREGATILTQPMDAPGIGRLATLVDPQGARISVITYESMQN